MARRLAAALAIALLLSGCHWLGFEPTPSPYVVRPDVRESIVPISSGNYWAVAWLRDGTIVLNRALDLHPWIGSTQVWELRSDGSGFARIPLPDDPTCRVTEYVSPTALSDGRLGLTKICHHELGSPTESDAYAVAYSIRTRALEVLTPAINPFPHMISWNPTLDQAISQQSSGIVGSIFEINRHGTKLLHLPIRDGSNVFWLDDYFHANLEDDAQVAREGRAEAGDWSPDGRTIAFLAEARSIGLTGFDRMDVPFDMYFMSPDGSHLRQVMPEVEGPGLVWSPDGRYLVFGHAGGLWLWRVGSSRAVRISSVSPFDVAWSPEGRSLAAVRTLNNDDNQYELLILNLSPAYQATWRS